MQFTRNNSSIWTSDNRLASFDTAVVCRSTERTSVYRRTYWCGSINCEKIQSQKWTKKVSYFNGRRQFCASRRVRSLVSRQAIGLYICLERFVCCTVESTRWQSTSLFPIEWAFVLLFACVAIAHRCHVRRLLAHLLCAASLCTVDCSIKMKLWIDIEFIDTLMRWWLNCCRAPRRKTNRKWMF